MEILYLYNEILPQERAHDVYVVYNALSLAQEGWPITLGVGAGTPPVETLLHYYGGRAHANFRLLPLPIVRRNYLLPITLNQIFNLAAQRTLRKRPPAFLITSVLKQGIYHHTRRIDGVRYIYEVHQLTWYPHHPPPSPNHPFKKERQMLASADLVLVTTESLREILLAPPYSLPNRVEVLPLAVHTLPLPPSHPRKEESLLEAAYIGQLYPSQGVPLLIEALQHTEGVRLHIVGGQPEEVALYRRLAHTKGVEKCCHFLGFQPPHTIHKVVESSHCFLMPSANLQAKPHVAHTKLSEYARLGRPIIAPIHPLVQTTLGENKGILPYRSGEATSLAAALQQLKNEKKRREAEEAIRTLSSRFTWEKRAAYYSRLLKELLVSSG